ncbi:MAG: anaerobic ribonucleoside-triphosphate reductase [Desulfurococcaceae archaeon]
MSIMGTSIDPLLRKYSEWSDFDVLENANRYPGPTGFASYVAERAFDEIARATLPKELAEAHSEGIIYIHKLPWSIYLPYCTGHSIQRIVQKGLVTPTISSRPAKHFDTFVDHVANYLITMQHYFTGAQALSSIEWYSGPFIRRNSLDYVKVKQNIQRLLFNLNYPSRVGMQCLSEDTEILTPEGWKSYSEVRVGDQIYTFNIETHRLEVKEVKHVFVGRYSGKMYNLLSRTQDQLISPRHRVVRLTSKGRYKLEPIEDVLKLKLPIPIPTPAITENSNLGIELSDEQIKLAAWVLSRGHVRKSKNGLTIAITLRSRGSSPKDLEEITGLLKHFNLEYKVKVREGGCGKTHIVIKLPNHSSMKTLDLIKGSVEEPPKWLYKLNKSQARIFIEAYASGSKKVGWSKIRIATSSPLMLKALEAVAVLAGYSVSLRRVTSKNSSNRITYLLTLTNSKHSYISKVVEVDYDGVIWSVNTDNETVIARRNGCIFITGNTPFTNFTIALDAPRKMLDGDCAYISGERAGALGVYEVEARTFVKALSELYKEGDAVGQPFTFPIPTLMATAKMLWNDPEVYESIFTAASKRGSFYWLNTRIVDPDATYAMCLHGGERIIFKARGRIHVAKVREFFRSYAGVLEAEEPGGAKWYVTREEVKVLAVDIEKGEAKWMPVKRLLTKKFKKAVRLKLTDGRTALVSPDHPVPVYSVQEGRIEVRKALELVSLAANRDYMIPVLVKEVEEGESYGHSRSSIGEAKYISELVKEVPAYRTQLTDFSYINAGNYFAASNSTLNMELSEAVNAKCRNAITESINELHLWSEGEHLPEFLWSSPLDFRKIFILELLNSHGSSSKGTWRLHLWSAKMAEEIMLLASITGMYCYLKRLGGLFEITFLTDVKRSDVEIENSKFHRIGDLVWVAIDEAEEVELESDEDFYDIEIDGSHYFVHSLGIVTHNCCRIAIDLSEFKHLNNKYLLRDLKELKKESLVKRERMKFSGVWAIPDVTGSINVVDVNLPRVALESRGNDNAFWERLSDVLAIARRALEWFRARYIKLLKDYPAIYSMVSEYLWEFPGSHFNTIGLIGLPEAAAIMMGDPKLWIEGSRGEHLGAAEWMKRVVEYIVKTARDWMAETGVPWNVEEVPGESAAAKLANKDASRYPEILNYIPDPSNPIYSTSIAPYYAEISIAEKVEIESMVQKYFTGGVMMHIFLSEEPDPDALASLTKRLINTDVVYWSYTPALTICRKCGKSSVGVYSSCPKCGSIEVDVWSRIVGYYRPLRNWNPYRRREFYKRKHYSSSLT